MKGRPNTRGVALVSVLLIVAAASALAYQMAMRHAVDLIRSQRLFDASQARQYALGGEAYARQLLYEDARDSDKDTLLEPWRLCGEAPPAAETTSEPANDAAAAFDINNGVLTVCVRDLRARFNLNALAGRSGDEHLERLRRLLSLLQIDADVAELWSDWVDADESARPTGAEDGEYLTRAPPHRAANGPAAHLSEFFAVAPLPAEALIALRPHVAALPHTGLLVNVNTATAEVLGALDENMSLADGQLLADAPREFDTVQAAVVEVAKLSASSAVLGVGSDFFEVQARAEVGDASVVLTAVIHRGERGLRTVSRNFGERWRGAAAAAGGESV